MEGEVAENDWDDHEITLSALDTLGEDFEHQSVANGEFPYVLSIVPSLKFNTAGKLSERDMSILRAYALKVNEHMTNKAFAKIPFSFPKEPVPSVKVCRALLLALSGFKPVPYDCCINSCCCFAGEHKGHMNCPYCGQDRYIIDRRGKKRHRKSSSTCLLSHALSLCRPTPSKQQRCDIEPLKTNTQLV